MRDEDEGLMDEEEVAGLWVEGNAQVYVWGLRSLEEKCPGFPMLQDEEYCVRPGNRTFVTPAGEAGFALLRRDDGRLEIGGVFNRDLDFLGLSSAAVEKGFLLGGSVLSAFENGNVCLDDPILEGEPTRDSFSRAVLYFTLLGVKPVSYLEFDAQHPHPGCDCRRLGSRGLVNMLVPQEAFDDRIGWLKKAWSAHEVQDFCEEIEAMRPRRESQSAARRRGRFKNPDEFGPDYINAYDRMEAEENREFWAKHGGRLAYMEYRRKWLASNIAAIKRGKARFV